MRQKLPIIFSGSLDALRAAANHARISGNPVTFVLSDHLDIPIALNLLEDASISAFPTVTMLLTPKPIENEDKEVLDPFFDNQTDELPPDPDIVVAADLPPPKHPFSKRGELAAENRIKRDKMKAAKKASKLAARNAKAAVDKLNKQLPKPSPPIIPFPDAARDAKRAYMREYMRRYTAKKKSEKEKLAKASK